MNNPFWKRKQSVAVFVRFLAKLFYSSFIRYKPFFAQLISNCRKNRYFKVKSKLTITKNASFEMWIYCFKCRHTKVKAKFKPKTMKILNGYSTFEFSRAFSECVILFFCYIVCSSGKTFVAVYSVRVYNNTTKNSTKRLRDVTRENSNIEYPSKIFVVFGLNLALTI